MARPRKQVNLLPTFRGPRVLTLAQLGNRMHCSRSTVLRRLREHGYHSSYNHRGKFFTIAEVADFDSRGLWDWKEARFSMRGTLKDSVEHFVEASECGMTHEELAGLLGVCVHNALLDLVQQKRIRRERIGPCFVYLHRKRRIRREQAHRRIRLVQERKKPRPTSHQIIATLLELIAMPSASREEVVMRCQRTGMSISRPLVDAIFETYDLDKKRAP